MVDRKRYMLKNFSETVYQILRTVPKGKVVTYGQLAELSGKPKAARAIGMLMAKNPDAPHTPCHRVVASDGSLHGYSGGDGLPTKMKMLVDEGVAIKNNKVDLSISRWNGK
jgi:O-6-methylguanine DNA methyltransferase